jgi:CheY-like chemotaxis protein
MHIILCSGNSTVQRIFVDGLVTDAARVTVCDSGMELLAAVRSMAAELVVLDLNMHGLGGTLLASAVQELAPGLPILAVSATVETDPVPVVQRGIPHVVLGSQCDEELRTLVMQLSGRRGAVLGAASR